MTAAEATDGFEPDPPSDVPPGATFRVMSVTREQFLSDRWWTKPRPLLAFRAGQRAERDAEDEAERVRRQRLDWAAYIPDPDPSPEPDPAPEPASSEPAATPAPESASPVPPVRDADDLRALIIAEKFRGAEESARTRAAAGELDHLPDAAEYATWSSERLAALGADPEELDDEAWDDEGTDSLDVHPVYLAVDEVQRAQRQLNEAEAERVQAAVSAWRVAQASITGIPDTTRDSTYFDAIIMDLAAKLQIAERTASTLIHTAIALETKTPACWRLFTRGEVPWRAMQMLHARLDTLDEAHWAAFDGKAAEVLITVAVPKLKKRLRTIRERIQPENAVERHKKARKQMRVTIEPLDDGMAEIIAVVPAPEAVSIDQRLQLAATAAAGVEGETRTVPELSAHILLDIIDEGLFRGATPDTEGLAVPTRRGVHASVGVLVPIMTVLGHSTEPATLEGYGPIDIETAKRLLGTAKSFYRVLTEEHTGIIKDIGRTRYRPTKEMRRFLGIVDGGGRGPNSDRPPNRTQIDHVIPYRQRLARGKTALDNLVLLAIRDHRIKTSGLWDIGLFQNRDLAWTSFYGTRIITTVEPTGPTPIPDHLRRPAEPDTDTDTDDQDCPF